jgi:hypothetical protein
MTKLVLLVAFAAISSQAAKFETCMKEVGQECGNYAAKMANYATAGSECKIVQGGEREEYPHQRYATKVIFKDANTLFSIVTDKAPGQQVCSYRRVDIAGKFKEDKALEGRLFAVTSGGNIIVISRINTIKYLTNKDGNPYQNVTDIKMDVAADVVEVYFNGNKNPAGATKLSLKQVLDKLNKPSLSECVPGGC